jgi:type I restriction enzyme, S subunit
VIKLPEGWNRKMVSSLFDVQLGKMLNEEARQGPLQQQYLANYNVRWGYFDLSRLKTMHFSQKERRKFALRKGDLVVCEGGEVGRCAVWCEDIMPCYYQKALHRLRPKTHEIIPEYMLYYMQIISGTKILGDMTSESSIAHLTREKILDLQVLFPPTHVQQKIVDVLIAWDEAIRKTQRLISGKFARHKSLCQNLLNVRSPLSPLGDFLQPILREVSKPNQPYWALGIRSHGKGTFRRQIDDPDTIAMETLYQVQGNDLIVNITFAWEGAVALVNEADQDCLVSHRFPTYAIDRRKALPDYLRHVIVQRRFVHNLQIISPGGAGRNRVLSKQDFLRLQIALPSLEEQQRIGEILNTSETEIALLQRKLAALQKQKRGLMQKLLTGKWRLKTGKEVS